jgi:hypothetical protein
MKPAFAHFLSISFMMCDSVQANARSVTVRVVWAVLRRRCFELAFYTFPYLAGMACGACLPILTGHFCSMLIN